MTSRKLALSVGVGCLLGGASAAPAGAQPSTSPEAPPAIHVVGDCPSPAAIWTDVRAMVLASDLGKFSAARIDIADLGTSYRVRIARDEGEKQRTFRDADHDCDRRAHFAAVFIVVTFLLPDVLQEPPNELPPASPVAAATPSPTAVVVTSPATSAPPRRRLHLDLSALLDAAPGLGDTGESAAFGAEVRAFWGASRFAATTALGIEPRASFDFGGVGVDELRAPFDLGVAMVNAWVRFALLTQVGVAGALVRIAGANTAKAQSGTRVDLGARLAVAVRFGSSSSRLSPVIGLHALIFPKPYEAAVIPQGTVGKLPALWLGLTAGLSFAP
jgi:hypothetical protein